MLVCPALDWLDSIQSVVSRVADTLAPQDPALAARVRQYEAELTSDQPIWPTLAAIWLWVPGPVINEVYNPRLDTRPYAQWPTTALQQGQFTDADRARAPVVCEQLDWTMFQSSGVTDLQRYTGPVLLIMGRRIRCAPVASNRRSPPLAVRFAGFRGAISPLSNVPSHLGTPCAHGLSPMPSRRGPSRMPRTAPPGSRDIALRHYLCGESGASARQGVVLGVAN